MYKYVLILILVVIFLITIIGCMPKTEFIQAYKIAITEEEINNYISNAEKIRENSKEFILNGNAENFEKELNKLNWKEERYFGFLQRVTALLYYDIAYKEKFAEVYEPVTEEEWILIEKYKTDLIKAKTIARMEEPFTENEIKQLITDLQEINAYYEMLIKENGKIEYLIDKVDEMFHSSQKNPLRAGSIKSRINNAFFQEYGHTVIPFYDGIVTTAPTKEEIAIIKKYKKQLTEECRTFSNYYSLFSKPIAGI